MPADGSIDAFVALIEDDASRAALIARLRAGGATVPPAEARDATAPPGEAGDATLPRRIAQQTRTVAEGVADGVVALVALLTGLGGSVGALSGLDLARLGQVALRVGLVGLGLFGAFFLFGWPVHRFSRLLMHRAGIAGPLQRVVLLLSLTAADAIRIVVAWLGGYLMALLVVGGPTGRMDLSQTLLVNAFLLSEGAKLLLRTVLCPRRPPLRFLPLDDTTAAYWYFWLARIASLLAYGFTFAAPVLATQLSADASHAVRVLTLLVTTAIGAAIILQNRIRVRNALSAPAAAGRGDALARLGVALGRVWHIAALAYLLTLTLAWLINPLTALPFLLSATWRSLIALAAGWAVVAAFRRLVAVGTHVPEEVRERLPMLEGRLNAFLPRVLQVTRLIVLVVVLAAIAQIWGLANFTMWLSGETGRRVTGSLVSAGLVLLMGMAAYLALASWVEYRLNPNYGAVPTARERTLLLLFRNAVTIALTVLVVMLVLAELGVNIAPLLAGAGVLGLAIGFGSQELVKDIITGAFIQFENAMNTGDVVKVAGVTGTVEKLTIRSVSIRDLGGVLHVIPFSSVSTVSNTMRDFSFHLAEIGVAYRENIPEVKQAMQDAFETLRHGDHGGSLIGPMDMQGLTAFGDSSITVRARIRTLPGQQWAVGRAYNEIVKALFDERGIEMPFPHVTLYMGEDKQGHAPPLSVRRAPPLPAG